MNIEPTHDSLQLGRSNWSERNASLLNSLKGFEEYTLDENGFIVHANLAEVTITGYEEWDVIGKHIAIFYPIEDQLIGKPCQDLSKTTIKGELTFTTAWLKKRNSTFLARIRIHAMKDGETLTGYRMHIYDATYKVVTNQKIRRLKDEYLALFNNSFVGVVKFTMSTHIIQMMNEKAKKMIGNEVVKISEAFESQEHFLALMQLLIEKKKIENYQFKQAGKDAWLTISVRYFPGSGFVEGMLMDITDSRKKDRELSRLSYELDQFIYHASHELRAPITSMLGVINLIKLEKGEKAGLEYVNVLERLIYKLDNLLRNIAAISYGNRTKLSASQIDWCELIEMCIKESQLYQSKILIETSVEEDCPFMGDRHRCKIIVTNILSNALRYYNPNRERPRVRIGISVNVREVRLTISDNGIGIDQKYLKTIFDMFFKAHEYVADGHGMGLYVVKMLLNQMGGEILVKSKIGDGTTFEILIPNKINVAAGI